MYGADSLSEMECCIATRQNKMAAPDVVSARFKKLNVFSSTEHEVLMVSCCGHSMSVMCHAASTIASKAYSYTPGPIDSIHGRKHRGDL